MTMPFNFMTITASNSEQLISVRKLIVLFTVVLTACTDKPVTTSMSDADIALNNRGVALMGRFDYRSAVDIFGELSARKPQLHDVRTNLAIALKNRQETDDGELALEQLKIVLAEQPDNLRANYVAGVLQLYLGRVDLAAAYFEAVIAIDPQDAYTHYYLGQCKLRSDDPSGALISYQTAIVLDPYLRSAYYSAAQILRRLDRNEEANAQLSLFKRFENNPRARLAEFKYTRMGPMSLAAVVGEQTITEEGLPIPTGPLFAERRLVSSFKDTKLAKASFDTQSSSAGITTVDFDQDGTQDLFLQGNGVSKNRLLLSTQFGDQQSGFIENSSHPWSKVSDINAVAWGDVDNNGLVDVYLCRTGANQLWLQMTEGAWTRSGDYENTNDINDCTDATFVDADHDGDLDILIANRAAGNNLLNNNRDGTFRSLADKLGNAAKPGNTRHIMTSDIDGDNDIDLIFINETTPHVVLINDRLWNYVPSTNDEEFRNSSIISLAAADLDADGQTELISIDKQGIVKLWQIGDGNQWRSTVLYQSTLPNVDSVNLVLLDLNGNGHAELVLLAAGAFEVIALTPVSKDIGWTAALVVLEEYIGGAAIPINRSLHGSSFIALGQEDGQMGLLEWGPGAGRFKFATLAFSGKHDAAETMRSNHSGIGTQVSVRNGSQWSRDDTHKHSSLRGFSLQPLSIGLAGKTKADFIAIDWSDGVYQTELDLDSSAIHRVSEEQRQLGSCPVLFVWNGTKFDFVTDILGVAAQGFLVEPGTIMPPRPWERVTFPPGSLASKDGRIMFKVTEPMEENSYIDSLSLESYDVPADWQIIVDERMGTGAPKVTGETMFYQKSLSPARAYNEAGENVLASILEHDQYAMPPGEIDRRYIGLLKAPESLTIEFDQTIDHHSDRPLALPVLVAENWLELPYSQTHFAAWQAGRQYQSISLEARDAAGDWLMVYPEFGIPGGMPRTMSLPLPSLPAGTQALRFSWNRELYWDRVRIVYTEQAPTNIAVQKSAPTLAKVIKSGFYERVNHPQRRPEYVYQKRKTFADVRYPTGFYTRLGEMTDLVSKADDALAIIGPGEEIHVEFEELPPPAPGLERWYVLETKGWAKDSDRYTHQGDTVGPLPRAHPDSSSEAIEALHQKYNTRFQSGM